MKLKSAIYAVLLSGLLLPLMLNCKKEAVKVVPTIIIVGVNNTTPTTPLVVEILPLMAALKFHYEVFVGIPPTQNRL